MKVQDQHPLIFGYVVNETIALCGAEGKKAVEEAVRLYGARRGRRMAEKAKQNGYNNDLLGYLLFGEFDVSEVGNVYAITCQEPCLEVHMTQCFWYNIWAAHGLLDYGKFYCRDIDTSLIRGFNGGVRFDAYDRFSSENNMCKFVYHDWPFANSIMTEFLEKSKEVAKIASKPWEYHAADVYQALSITISKFCGATGEEALRRGLLQFTKQFGEEASQNIIGIVNKTDFNES
jgi:hypothetical protein